MADTFDLTIPACYSQKTAVEGNPVRQLLVQEQTATVVQDATGGFTAVLASGEEVPMRRRRVTAEFTGRILTLPHANLRNLEATLSLENARWEGVLAPSSPDEVRASHEGAFRYIEDDPALARRGLRTPQLGAIHAVLGYWTTATSEPGTVVMPTGTGKTDTMVALLCAARLERLLVVVPSDALREQIAEKFETLGVLQQFGILSPSCLRPVVGRIRHSFKTTEAAAAFADKCNIIIATPQVLFAMADQVRHELLAHCSHLFIDEAHHVAAETWRQIRDEFNPANVVQFTATPFREDGRRIGGRLVYVFPLREAQRQRYFSTITYASVVDFSDQDGAIARRAVAQLRKDLEEGLDHIIMARVSRIGRASDVLQVYQAIAPDLSPVVLHSTNSARDRQAALESIRTRRSRIIVCVNMLGEGFDLPALKIAAIHDAHRSLAITLQFIGRFARTTGSQLGEATVVVSRPDGPFDPQLRRLYSEDSDWNFIIRDLSETAVQGQQQMSDFEAAFGSLPDEVSIRSLMPKMSTVVYRTRCTDWVPTAVLDHFGEDRLLTVPIAINEQDAVAWFVVENREPVSWGDVKTVEQITYDLYVLYWDRARQLLYVNSSNNDSVHEELAQAICGDDVARVTGETVYRVMANVQRLVPTTVGLLDVRNRSRRFTMHVGADVEEAFPTTEAQTKTKTNISAYGYEEGSRLSISASLKGRIWSHRAAESIRHWMLWCDAIGTKVTDDGIDLDDIMRNFIRPKTLDERPILVPLGMEWPYELFANPSDEVRISFAESSWPVIDVDLELTSQATAGPITFCLKSPHWSIPYRLEIGNPCKFIPDNDDGTVVNRHQSVSLADFLNKRGLHVLFEQDALAMIPPGVLLKPDRTILPYNPEKLIALDWSGIDLTAESQGSHRRKDSIQYRMIEHILSLRDWDVVLDDDGSGEIADIVAIKEDGQDMFVHLTHCKFVLGGHPRARVEDLYQVCGQAQKSAKWRRSPPVFLNNLIRRERRRRQRGASGLIKGDGAKLYSLLDRAAMLRSVFTFAVAQPGVTKAGVTASQLELLACTETYLYETANGTLEVYCSP